MDNLTAYDTETAVRIGFDQKVRFESVGSKFESNSNPSFSYNLTVFYDFVMNRDVLSVANMRHNP